jgi:hypothetical protein
MNEAYNYLHSLKAMCKNDNCGLKNCHPHPEDFSCNKRGGKEVGSTGAPLRNACTLHIPACDHDGSYKIPF